MILDGWKSDSFTIGVRNKAMPDASWCVIHAYGRFFVESGHKWCYIYLSVGFCVARSTPMSNVRTSSCRTGDRFESTLFLYTYANTTKF